MKLISSILLTFFLAAASFAQANSLKQISFVFDRYNGYASSVKLAGDNIDVSAQFRSSTSPVACQPCTANTVLRFGPALDDSGIIGASGTIDGVFYPNLYVLHSLHYSGQDTPLPKLWAKTVRVSAPLTLTGNIGVWRTPDEVGSNSVALYLHNNLNFAGMANLLLRKTLDWPSRQYHDKYLSLTFSYVE